MAGDTYWMGGNADKLWLNSGQFTSTRLASLSVGGVDGSPQGMEFDGTNTVWSGNGADKHYLTSGSFSSTLKDSQLGSPEQTQMDGISSQSSGDTSSVSSVGTKNDTFILWSGQFTRTIKESLSVVGVDSITTGITWDGTNTPWSGSATDKVYLNSGQYTSTLLDSAATQEINPIGIGFDGTDTLYSCDSGGDQLFLSSGQFTTTLKTSIIPGDTFPNDLGNDDPSERQSGSAETGGAMGTSAIIRARRGR